MSQLRKHLKFTWRNHWRAFIERRRLALLGKRVHLDKCVEFLRFPGGISVDDDVVVKEGARICAANQNATIFIGKRTTIGYHTFIFASDKIVIGDDCLIAPFVYIVDSNHQIKRSAKINEQPNATSPIVIGNDVWIASNVTVLSGVTIGQGAVIGANSVVNSSVPPYEIWAGTPAKKISERT